MLNDMVSELLQFNFMFLGPCLQPRALGPMRRAPRSEVHSCASSTSSASVGEPVVNKLRPALDAWNHAILDKNL